MSKINNLHPQAKKIEIKLQENGIISLYHFTDIHNLPLIARCGGLWSKSKLEKEGLLSKIITGGDLLSLNLDKNLSNWDKVHLYFCPHTPMAYRKQQKSHICYFKIDIKVALIKGVVFTDTNATRIREPKHQRGEGVDGINLIDFNIIKRTLHNGPQPTNPQWHRKVQAEILVPDKVPLKFFKEVIFISEASQREGERLWGHSEHPPFQVNKDIFTHGIPYLESAILTKEKIDKNVVEYKNYFDQNTFKKEPNLKISLLLSLYSTAGLKAETLWKSHTGKIVSKTQTEFEKQGKWWYWPSLNVSGLSAGDYFVEFYLRDIHWITIPFKLMEAE